MAAAASKSKIRVMELGDTTIYLDVWRKQLPR